MLGISAARNSLKNEIQEVNRLLDEYKNYLEKLSTYSTELPKPLQASLSAWREFCKDVEEFGTIKGQKKGVLRANQRDVMRQFIDRFTEGLEETHRLTKDTFFPTFKAKLYECIRTILAKIYNIMFAGSIMTETACLTDYRIPSRHTLTTCRSALFSHIVTTKAIMAAADVTEPSFAVAQKSH
jgi:hypothetical protein